MAPLLAAEDNDQQNPGRRNTNLANLLNGPWNADNITHIRREPIPTNPPDPNGPQKGRWEATTV